MDEYTKSNKIKCVYWLKETLDNIKIKIQTKPREGVITFPKFKDYTNETENPQIIDSSHVDEYIISWQEKLFSRCELQLYADIQNCSSERDLHYHEMIESQSYKPSKIFTYTHEDDILPLPCANREIKTKSSSILNLNTCLSKLDTIFGDDHDSMRHLFKSEINLSSPGSQWMSMHIVWDNSEYNEDSQVLFKEECLLVSLYYNTVFNYLIISPDTNSLEHNPYNIQTDTGILGYEYSITVDFDEVDSTGELVTLLNKLSQKLGSKHKNLLNFVMPPLGRNKVYIAFEIVSAMGFDMDNIYIEYNMKVADEVKCAGELHGRTHVSSALRTSDLQVWKYGHVVDLELEYNTGVDPSSPKIYLEVISTDWWGRHRTEGYTCLCLSLEPGVHSRRLSCSRPEEIDRVEAESRRFFVGGCHLIKELDVLANPSLHKTNFRYVSTGTIAVRWNVITQTHKPGAPLPVPASSAADLLQGADAVLRKYHKAKATLAAATKDLTTGSGDG